MNETIRHRVGRIGWEGRWTQVGSGLYIQTHKAHRHNTLSSQIHVSGPADGKPV